jgi:hypothetical protein
MAQVCVAIGIPEDAPVDGRGAALTVGDGDNGVKESLHLRSLNVGSPFSPMQRWMRASWANEGKAVARTAQSTRDGFRSKQIRGRQGLPCAERSGLVRSMFIITARPFNSVAACQGNANNNARPTFGAGVH